MLTLLKLDSIALKWKPPQSAGGGIEGYLLYFDREGEDAFVEIDLPATTTQYSTRLALTTSIAGTDKEARLQIPTDWVSLPCSNVRLQRCGRESHDRHFLHSDKAWRYEIL